jgi:hypothetical protein
VGGGGDMFVDITIYTNWSDDRSDDDDFIPLLKLDGCAQRLADRLAEKLALLCWCCVDS